MKTIVKKKDSMKKEIRIIDEAGEKKIILR